MTFHVNTESRLETLRCYIIVIRKNLFGLRSDTGRSPRPFFYNPSLGIAWITMLAVRDDVSCKWFTDLQAKAPEAFLKIKVLDLHDMFWSWPQRYIPPNFPPFSDEEFNQCLNLSLRSRGLQVLRLVVLSVYQHLGSVAQS
jgi:hypothetical protein